MGWFSTDLVILAIWIGLAGYFVALYLRSSADADVLARHARRFADWRMHVSFVGRGLSFCRDAWPLVVVIALLCIAHPDLIRYLARLVAQTAQTAVESKSTGEYADDLRKWAWLVPGLVLLPASVWGLFYVRRRRRRWAPKRFAALHAGAWLLVVYAGVCTLIAAALVMPKLDWRTLEERAFAGAGVSTQPSLNLVRAATASAREIFLAMHVAQFSRYVPIAAGVALVAGLPWLLALLARARHPVKRARRRFVTRTIVATAAVCTATSIAGMVTALCGDMSIEQNTIAVLLYVFWVAAAVLVGALGASYLVAFAAGKRGSDLHRAAFEGFPAVYVFMLLFQFVFDFEHWIVLGTVKVLGEDYAQVGLTTGLVWRLFGGMTFLVLAYVPFFGVLRRCSPRKAARSSLSFWHRHVGLSAAFFVGGGLVVFGIGHTVAQLSGPLVPVWRVALVALVSLVFVSALARELPEIVAQQRPSLSESTTRSPA